MATGVVTVPPAPMALDEQQRVEHTRLRRRLLYSLYSSDLDARIRRQIGNVKADMWGDPDLTANPYLSLWSQVSVLYNVEPEIMAPAGSEGLAEIVADAGYWPMMQRVQRDTLALREMLVRVDVDDDGDVSFRPVFPDYVECDGDPRRPHVPVRISEWMPHARYGFCQHVLDVRDPANPTYRVYDTHGAIVTVDCLGAEFDGAAYPYRDSAGRPILPYVVYHAAQTGCMFDPYTMREVVEGSLNLGVLLTYYGHIVRNAAWAQRYGIGVQVVGADTIEEAGQPARARTEITTDPGTVVLFSAVEGATNPQVGTFQNPVDPEAVLRSISMYERRILMLANFAPDVTRQEADVRSGYSLAVAREAVREQQAVYEPMFRQGDQQVLRIAACLINGRKGTAYSETPRDYRIAYKGLPKSPTEEKIEAEALKVEVESKRIGPISAYMRRYPGVTYEEALDRLARAAVEESSVVAAVADLTLALGGETPPQTVDIEVGKTQAAQLAVIAASKGEMPPEAAKQYLIRVLGLAPEDAEAIIEPVREWKPPTPAGARAAPVDDEPTDDPPSGGSMSAPEA